jgi:hypothetical protein
MWNSQWFFVITELPITAAILHLTDSRNHLSSNAIVIMYAPHAHISRFSMASLHIILALPEKMLWSLFFSGYDKLPVARDLLLMGGDFSAIMYSIYLWKNMHNTELTPTRNEGNERKAVMLFISGAIIVVPCFIFYHLFCSF